MPRSRARSLWPRSHRFLIPPRRSVTSSEMAGATIKLFFREAIARALAEEMSRDQRIILLGQDIGRFGGSYKEFIGLFDAFGPARVRDTPVAEGAMIGVGIGAAAAGARCLVSITYMDFLM